MHYGYTYLLLQICITIQEVGLWVREKRHVLEFLASSLPQKQIPIRIPIPIPISHYARAGSQDSPCEFRAGLLDYWVRGNGWRKCTRCTHRYAKQGNKCVPKVHIRCRVASDKYPITLFRKNISKNIYKYLCSTSTSRNIMPPILWLNIVYYNLLKTTL